MISVAVQMLVPSKKYSGIPGIVLGIFIIYTLLSPLKKAIGSAENFTVPRIDFGGTLQTFEYYENAAFQSFDRAVYNSAARAVEIQAQKGIAEITDAAVEVKAAADSRQTRIWVSGVPPEAKDRIYEYIKNSFGVEPVITE